MARSATVTGAFSNTGSAVARELLGRGWDVSTLTNRTPPAGHRLMRVDPLVFDRNKLVAALSGTDVLVNTYWVRFPYRDVSYQSAVGNTLMLFDAAREAGVKRIVQVSVSNASSESELPYYHGKAEIDSTLAESGISHAIVRPTLIVGPNDILSNNIAWFIRRFPVIGIPAGEGYRMQPLTLDDAGRIVADAVESADDLDIDAAGPETFSFREYVTLLARVLNRERRVAKLTLPPKLMIALLALTKPFLRDTVLTWEELEGLRQNMLVSHQPPLGTESVTAWVNQHGGNFGRSYANDTLERFRVPTA